MRLLMLMILLGALVATGCSEDGTTEGSSTQLVVFSGNDQQAPISTQLPDPFVVQVVRGTLAGREIEWAVEQGGGAVTQTLSTTDEDGLASTFLTLGPTEGENRVRATLVGTNESLVFTAIGVEP